MISDRESWPDKHAVIGQLFFFCVACVSALPAAAGLGGLRVQSRVDEPFVASVAVNGEEADLLQRGGRVVLSDKKLSAKVSSGDKNRAVIVIRSAQPVREPVLTFQMSVGAQTRQYNALLDPPSSYVESKFSARFNDDNYQPQIATRSTRQYQYSADNADDTHSEVSKNRVVVQKKKAIRQPTAHQTHQTHQTTKQHRFASTRAEQNTGTPIVDANRPSEKIVANPQIAASEAKLVDNLNQTDSINQTNKIETTNHSINRPVDQAASIPAAVPQEASQNVVAAAVPNQPAISETATSASSSQKASNHVIDSWPLWISLLLVPLLVLCWIFAKAWRKEKAQEQTEDEIPAQMAAAIDSYHFNKAIKNNDQHSNKTDQYKKTEDEFDDEFDDVFVTEVKSVAVERPSVLQEWNAAKVETAVAPATFAASSADSAVIELTETAMLDGWPNHHSETSHFSAASDFAESEPNGTVEYEQGGWLKPAVVFEPSEKLETESQMNGEIEKSGEYIGAGSALFMNTNSLDFSIEEPSKNAPLKNDTLAWEYVSSSGSEATPQFDFVGKAQTNSAPFEAKYDLAQMFADMGDFQTAKEILMSLMVGIDKQVADKAARLLSRLP